MAVLETGKMIDNDRSVRTRPHGATPKASTSSDRVRNTEHSDQAGAQLIGDRRHRSSGHQGCWTKGLPDSAKRRNARLLAVAQPECRFGLIYVASKPAAFPRCALDSWERVTDHIVTVDQAEAA
jgi:hypothetical protein